MSEQSIFGRMRWLLLIVAFLIPGVIRITASGMYILVIGDVLFAVLIIIAIAAFIKHRSERNA